MLSKNFLSVVAILLCAQASVLFGNVDEKSKSLTKKAARAAAAAKALEKQFEEEIIEEETDEEEKDEAEEIVE